MTNDLLIKNGTIVDGTGAARFRGDVAIAAGKIAEVGKVSGGARETIDASGLVVAPGFIEAHTHYDAQVFWDPMFTSSSWHGVTSVIAGNCGFTLAPCRPADRQYITHMLAVVEDMPLAALEAGLPWDWEGYPSYLQALERRPKALNMGCYVGYSTVRRNVLGTDFRREATTEEIARIQDVISSALRAGALGVSSSRIGAHVDGEGKSVPSFYGEMNELMAVARAMRQAGRGMLELTSKMVYPKGEHEAGDLAELVALAKESGRPVTWASVRYMPRYPERAPFILDEVSKNIGAQSVRLYPQMGCRKFDMYISWNKLMPIFAHLPSWRKMMFLRGSERLQAMKDPATRQEMRVDLANNSSFNGWEYFLVSEARLAENKQVEGKSIAAIAAAQNKDPLDAFLDLCVREDCETEFAYNVFDNDEATVGRMLKDSHTLIETDAGAHLATLCNADFPTFLLGHWVRETGKLSLEEVVAKLTSRPAEAFGLGDRGRLQPGFAADVTVFDPQRVGPGRQILVHDLPAQQARLIKEAEGVHAVVVNGQVILRDKQPTGACPGQVLKGS
jgi:N-acyl-D-aspartate/D-glutamate deacylase